jgi:uncharacterized damage-inducible protein DinB
MSHCVLPALALAAFSATAHAQANRAPTLAEAVRAGFTESSNRLLQAAEAIPEAQYDFKPAPTVRSIRQLISHIADGNNWYCAHAAGRNAQWSDSTEQANLPKAQVIARLRSSIAACNALPANAPRLDQLMANVGHNEHHYGNLVTTMRVAGLVPPQNN